MAALAYAWGRPQATARLRQQVTDFQVDEQLGFEPGGSGEHVFVQIRKQQLNSEQVARQLARLAQVKAGAVSFSGMKDKQAVTSQWFSVHLPGMDEPDWQQLNSEQLQVIQHARHRQKLRRGSHRRNGFVIVLREFRGARAQAEQCLQAIARHGVPNYFGAQRFGNAEANIARARAMLDGQLRVKDRHQRSLYLSRARALLFNHVLSQRVKEDSWNRALPGDALLLNGSNSFFCPPQIDSEIERRIEQHDIHPSGPLWGRGELATRSVARELEQAILSGNTALCAGLEQAGLKQERRALRLLVEDLQWQWLADDVLQLRFALPRGAYATSVIRQCCRVE